MMFLIRWTIPLMMFLIRWTIPLKNLFVQCTSPASKVSMISGGQVLGFHESSHTINSSGGHMETPLVNNFTHSTNSQVLLIHYFINKYLLITNFRIYKLSLFGFIVTSFFSFCHKMSDVCLQKLSYIIKQKQKPRLYFFTGFINWIQQKQSCKKIQFK